VNVCKFYVINSNMSRVSNVYVKREVYVLTKIQEGHYRDDYVFEQRLF